MAWIWVPDAPTCLSEPAVWELAEEVQEQQRMAEAVGCVHQLLLVLLQITPGECPWGSCPDLGSACSSRVQRLHETRGCQAETQESGRAGLQPAMSAEIFGSKTETLYHLPYSRCSVLNTSLRGLSWCS